MLIRKVFKTLELALCWVQGTAAETLQKILFLSNYLSTTYNESTHMIGDTTHIAYTYIYQSLQFKTYNSTEVRGIILAADV